MKNQFKDGLLLILTCFAILSIQGQGLPGWTQSGLSASKQDIRSNENWIFGLVTGASFSLKNQEAGLFRGNGLATKMFGRYYFGSVGLSVATGIQTGSIHENSLNKFIAERYGSQDRVNLTMGDALNGFLVFGPSFRFGNKLFINADVQGGLFFNNPGTVAVHMKADGSTMYRFENSNKKFSPGFSGSFSINYPLSPTTHFFINADYFNSRSSLYLMDLKNGYDVATELSRALNILVAGVGISKSFGGKPGAAENLKPSHFYKEPITPAQTQRSSGDTIGSVLQTNTGIISGSIYWRHGAEAHIVTNEMAAAAARMGKQVGSVSDQSIANTGLYIRKTGRGASKKDSPLFDDRGTSGSNPLYEEGVKNGENPLYQGSGNSGSNPLYGSRNGGNGGGLCGQTGHFLVTLTERPSGRMVATTTADSCGNFWFANVPDGRYNLQVNGYAIATTSQELKIMDEGKHAIGGKLQAGYTQLRIALNAQSGQGTFQSPQKVADKSGPERTVEVVCTEQAAGQPLTGVVVIGGKYPGGRTRAFQTDEDGKFEFNGLKKGTYHITSEISFKVSASVSVEAQDFNTTRNNRERGQ